MSRVLPASFGPSSAQHPSSPVAGAGPFELPRQIWWRALGLSFVWLLFTAWIRPLSLPDEGRYVGVAWEALRTGNWLVPTLNGLPFFHKPPLFYWITEASMALFGVHPMAARAAPLLGALAAAMSLFTLLHRWASPRLAQMTLAVLLAMPLFFLGAQFANLDMLVAGLITATIAVGADAALRAEHGLPYRRTLAIAFALAGFGLLAKGLIGFVLPGMVLGAWVILRRQWRTLRAMIWLPGLVLMAAIAVPWFLVMQSRYPDYLHFFVVVQHFQRFASTGFNNVQPFWFYPAVLALASIPALPWLYKGWKGTQWRREPGPAGLHWLLWLWFTLILVFFSIPQSKLVGYILPTVPPLAALTAMGWDRWASGQVFQRRGQRWAVICLGISAALGIIVVVAAGLGAVRTNRGIAQALAARMQPNDAVVMLERYEYDVPFYAGLQRPMMVVENWSDEKLMARDSWRKELWETRGFAGLAAEADNFQTWDSIQPALCARGGQAWLIGEDDMVKDHPWLARATVVQRQKHLVLWQLRTEALGCAPGAGARP